MKERPNLNELAKEIHNDNKLKGFHYVNWSDEHCLMLAICELCEAIEDDRSSNRNRTANIHSFNKKIKNSRSYKGLIDGISIERAYEVIYNETIKGSIDEELADFVIRLLDLAGKKNIKVDKLKVSAKFEDKSFTESIYFISKQMFSDVYLMFKIPYCISLVELLCNTLNIDLWLHVDLKLKYNKTRPYKHGKEY